MDVPENLADVEDNLIPTEGQESEEDLQGQVSFKNAVSMNTDWTIETINGQVQKGNIDLMPEFQRRTAWDNTRKSRLIESIIVGLPVPNIVLAEDKKRRGSFIVIDGKQRLVSISEFYTGKFSLTGLDIRNDLNGLRYSDLPESDRLYLDNSTLRSTLIRNWTDEKFLYIMFFRLNSGSLPLSPQELRKALIGGRLLERIETYIRDSGPFHSIFGNVPDKRMRDSELILRFVAFDKAFENYGGNLKEFLDETTRYFEDAQHSGELEERLSRLDVALATAHKIFGSNVFKKWLGEGYERVINRAIFDSIVRFFADTEFAAKYIDNSNLVIEAYKDICLNPDFKQSIERTTKSLPATRYRINSWGTKLANVIGMNYNAEKARIG